jgi:hypothetical protein
MDSLINNLFFERNFDGEIHIILSRLHSDINDLNVHRPLTFFHAFRPMVFFFIDMAEKGFA